MTAPTSKPLVHLPAVTFVHLPDGASSQTTGVLHEHVDVDGDVVRVSLTPGRGVLTLETAVVHGTQHAAVYVTHTQAVDMIGALAAGVKELTR